MPLCAQVADLADIFTGRLITEIPDALRALCGALVHLISSGGALEEVILSDNAFGGRSVEPLVPLLELSAKLKVIQLGNNGLGPEGGAVVADALARGAESARTAGSTSRLQVIVCGRNRLEDGSSAQWARALASHGNLEEVRLYQNGIRMKGLETIVLQGLAKNPHLRIIDLQDNTATLRGARAVATALSQWPNLSELQLSETLLRPRGGRMVVESLAARPFPAMSKIGLAFCDLGPDSVAGLSDVVRAMPKLQHVDVNGNFVEEDGPELEALREALEAMGHADALAETDEMDPEGIEDLSEDEDISDRESEDEAEAQEPTPAPKGEDEELAQQLGGLGLGGAKTHDTSVFSLAGKGLKLDTAADVEPYLQSLRDQEGLEVLILSGNTIGVGAAQALAEVIKTKKNLKVANLADIFTGRLITEIPDALRALIPALASLVPLNGSLEEVDLSDNAFGGRSVEPLVPLLEAAHALRVLKLGNNGLGPEGGAFVAQSLARGAQEAAKQGQASRLKVLVCGRNRLENGSAPAWASALAAHGGLEEVRLYQNGIRMEGIEAIVSKGLAANTGLKVVDLQDNTATLRGAKAVAKFLRQWPQLEELQLSETLLRPKGSALLIEALRGGNHPHLRRLGLAFCDIPATTLSALSAAIQERKWALEHLDINGNFAEEDGPELEALRQALASLGRVHALAETDEMDPEGDEDLSSDEDVSDHEADSEPAPAPEVSKAVTSALP